MGKSKPKIPVSLYYMSLDYALCHGPVERLRRIRGNEKVAWEGSVTAAGSFEIDADELFGGVKKEGGMAGRVAWHPGDWTQVMDAHAASKHDATPETMPGYRGIAHAYFTEEEGDDPGFYWSANTPYLPRADFMVTRIDRSWHPEIAAIGDDTFTAREYTSVESATTEVSVGARADWANDLLYVLEEVSPWVFEVRKYQLSTMTLLDGATASEIAADLTAGDLYLYFAAGSNALYLDVKPGVPAHDFVLRVDPDTLVETHRSPTSFTPYFPSASRFWIHGLSVVKAQNGKDFLLAVVEATTDSQSLVLLDGNTMEWVAGLYNAFATHHFYDAVVVGPHGIAYAFDHDWLGSAANAYTIRKIQLNGAEAYMGGGVTANFSGFNVAGTLTPADIDAGYAGTNARFGHDAITFSACDHDTPGVILRVAVDLPGGGEDVWLVRWREAAGVVWRVRETDLTSEVGGFDVPSSTSIVADGEFYLLGNASEDIYVLSSETGEVLDQIDVTASLVDDWRWVFNAATRQIVFSKLGTQVLITLDPAAEGDLPSMNPAHIIRECLVDQSWGIGLPLSLIDDAAFYAAALTLYNENFGLSLIWTRQTTIEAFVQEIQDHINAVVYVDPTTGRYTIKLIRNDYDPSGLPVFDPSNAELVNFSRRSHSEVTNEIVVTWTNPNNEEEEVLTIQDLGAIAINGGEIVSDSRNFYGVRDPKLAARLASREIASATAPLAGAEIRVNREGYSVTPGAVVKLTWPEVGANQMVMRVGKVDYGRPGDSAISISLTEDIFAYAQPEPIDPPESATDPLVLAPTPPFPTEAMTLPAFTVHRAGVSAPDADEAYVGLLVQTDNLDTGSVEVYGEVTDTLGNVSIGNIGTRSITGSALLTGDILAEASTTGVGFASFGAGPGPVVGGLGLIGPESFTEAGHELVAFTAVAGGLWTLRRGVLDTTPKTWPFGTRVRFLSDGLNIADGYARATGVAVSYSLRTRTSGGLLPASQAVGLVHTPSERYHAPLRPADCRLGTTGFGTHNAMAGGDVAASWANRNRLTEEQTILAWDAATVTPEAGQTTTLTLLDPDDGSVVATISGLTGTSHSIPRASFGALSSARVRFTSERDGLESIQGHEITVALIAGYGDGYGLNYGG